VGSGSEDPGRELRAATPPYLHGFDPSCPFDEADTRVSPFKRLDGSEVQVPTMPQSLRTLYVDENGTEAAAATAVVVGETSDPPRATLTINKPFVFAIIDRPTGATLFIGRVLDPSA
jgi:hypothetical protein